MDVSALFYILLTGTIYGSATVASRFCVGQFDPIVYTGLRFSMAACGYMAFYLFRIRGRRLPRNPDLWKHAALTGIIGNSLPVVLIVSSLQYLSSGVTATLVSFFPVIIVILAHFFLPDEPLSRRKMAGILLSSSGAVLIVALGETGLSGMQKVNPVGYLMILGASLISGVATLYVRKHLVQYDTFEVSSLRMLFSALFTLPLGILLQGFDLSRVTPTGYAVAVYASITLFFGFFLGFYTIQHFGVTVSAMADYIPPIVASLGGALLLGERITTGMLSGMVLILCGLAILNMRSGRMRFASRQKNNP